MTAENVTLPPLAGAIKKALPKVPCAASLTKTDLDLRVAPADLLALVQGLKDHPDLGFDYLRNVTGLDMQENGLELKYHFYSFKHGHTVQVTVATPPGESHLPTLAGLYAAADWHEREAAEMFGFVFDGHPDPRNLLLEEDLRIHPLLKAHPLQPVEIVQGIEDGRAGFEF
ncbi:MAG: NADH-quinone oxidoreductase subunit C [Thermoflexaceae bacterium]|nr:NADH-quinone oxidoreductase subunit C [Thermoflexaceae bacterium]